jgi:hypothetical protein
MSGEYGSAKRWIAQLDRIIESGSDWPVNVAQAMCCYP